MIATVRNQMSVICDGLAVNAILERTEVELSELFGEKVVLSMVKESDPPRAKIEADNELRRIVCDVCSVSWDEVVSPSRKKEFVIARQLYFYFARKFLTKYFTDDALAKNVDRERTLVSSSIAVVEDMVYTRDSRYVPKIYEIESRISESNLLNKLPK